jgi:hypothetical protein
MIRGVDGDSPGQHYPVREFELDRLGRSVPMNGAQFESAVKRYFSGRRLNLEEGASVAVGFGKQRKARRFDLVSKSPPVLVECKSHRWTRGRNAPEAKLAIWNESVLYFAAAPPHYRRILCVRRSVLGGWSLTDEYLNRYKHLVPRGVELWEYDPRRKRGRRVYTGAR